MVRFSAFVVLTLGWLACSPATAQQPGAAPQSVLLDFWLPTCGPCRQMDPIVSRLQQEGFPVRRVDGSREPQLASRFAVRRYPTFVMISGGREVHRFEGIKSYQELRTLLTSAGIGPVAARPASRQAGIVPATFAEPASTGPAAIQVGSDLGPAPAVTIPGASQPRRAAAPRASVAAGSTAPSPDRLLSLSVRIKVEDGSGSSYGAGTIIDARQGEALVLTCAHLFRDDTRQAPTTGGVSVELFRAAGGRAQVADRVVGQVISHDFQRDVALVSIRPNGPVETARVAASPTAVAVGDPIWSVGCDHGADPTVRTGSVTTTDRYPSPPSLTATGAPVVGRSGGGLFNARGEVVGVCFGSDDSADEGFYAKLSSIHAELDKLGLTEIYRGGAPAEMASTGNAPPAPPATAGDMVPVRPARGRAVVRGQDPFPARPADLARLSGEEQAALQELSRLAAESEVVCVVRPKEPGGRSEVITLDRVSPEFLQALRSLTGQRSR